VSAPATATTLPARPSAPADLALRAARQDRDAWTEVFARHHRTVFLFLRYRVADAAEAEDLASQVFEIGFTRAKAFDYRGTPIEAWLTGIARNLLRDHRKKLARRGIPEQLSERVEAALPVADGTTAADARFDLGNAMRRLTGDQQSVLALRFLADQSVADTARAMQRSEDAVKTLQRRALAAMRRELTEGGTHDA
jgi:RNA polymerase sigma-70 factor (ECF subfamily)